MIKQISKITSTKILAELRTFPTQAAIWDIIEKGASGKIYALDHDAVIIVENSNNPFVYIAGELTDIDLQSALAFLKKFQYPLIYCKPLYHPFFLKNGFDLLLRAELVLKNTLSFCNDNASDTQAKLIDNIELFQKCFWYKENLELFGSAENFLENCEAYAYVEDDVVLSEAYATIGGGYMEVSVATNPEYRGKGLVAKALRPLIKKCELEGLIPMWTCQLDNRSSFKSALKLGFEIERYYVTMVPESGNVLGRNLVKWMKDNPSDLENPFL